MKRTQKRKPVPRKAVKKPRSPLKRILVPIDFSAASKNALNYALPFAKTFGAELILVHVVEPTVYPADFSFGHVGFPNIEEELLKQSEVELSRLAQQAGKHVPTRSYVRTGKAFLEITRVAEEEGADLIIIATHGYTGVEHILFGSTTEKVVRKSPCAVLTVRTS